MPAKSHKSEDKPEPKAAAREDPLPGTAGMAQGQPGAGIEPSDAPPAQAAGPVTGAENIERQQKDPEIDDTSGAHP